MDIKYLVIDVDGTMTDGGLYYDENGNETKKFCTKDAAGFFAAHQVGMKIMVLTGRECKATTRRMTEMKVEYLCQNVKDKVNVRRHIVGGANRTLISVETPLRSCRIGTCRRLSAG